MGNSPLEETPGCMVLTGSVLARLISFVHRNSSQMTMTLPPVKQEPSSAHPTYQPDQATLKIYIKITPKFRVWHGTKPCLRQGHSVTYTKIKMEKTKMTPA